MTAEVLYLFSEHQCIQSAHGHCVHFILSWEQYNVTLQLKNKVNIKGGKDPN